MPLLCWVCGFCWVDGQTFFLLVVLLRKFMFFNFLRIRERGERDLGSVWMEEWKSGRMEMWEDGKYLVFPLVCLVGGVEKWEGGKLFCLVG